MFVIFKSVKYEVALGIFEDRSILMVTYFLCQFGFIYIKFIERGSWYWLKSHFITSGNESKVVLSTFPPNS